MTSAIYNGLFGGAETLADGATSVTDAIFQLAEDCLVAGVGANFENKIVLSIAIRLKAEQYMVEKIADPAFVDAIAFNQTPALLNKFRKEFPGHAAGPILDRVTLMTPENIHLNAFMYEPILDMSDEHLRKLYLDVKALP